MEKLFEIDVTINGSQSVRGSTRDICMIFFSGEASGKYFSGKVIGTGTDTQNIMGDGSVFLSARYMLEGTDIDGKSCRIFKENNGSHEKGFLPKIVTDSKALSVFEEMPLRAEITGTEKGVIVSVSACR